MKRKPIKYATREGRVKTTLWLDRDVMTSIGTEAEGRRVSKQSVIENSLKARYSEAQQVEWEAVIVERLNKIDRGLRKLESRIDIAAEAHALFVRMWLTSTPEIDECDRDSAVAQARIRFDRYVKRLAQNVGSAVCGEDEVRLKRDDFK